MSSHPPPLLLDINMTMMIPVNFLWLIGPAKNDKSVAMCLGSTSIEYILP